MRNDSRCANVRTSSPANTRLSPQFKSELAMLTIATIPTAPRPLRGTRASLSIRRAAGGEVATTKPPIATNAICMVNVVRLQKPSPNARLTVVGDAPLTSAASATTSTAISTNTKASGNQRSAQAVNRIAMRASALSADGSAAAVTVFPLFDSVKESRLTPKKSRPWLLLRGAEEESRP